MSEEQPAPAHSEGSQPGAAAQPQPPPGPGERYGIVSISRHVKDDGRALLLFTRSGRGGQ